MSLLLRVAESKNLSSQERLLLGLLDNEPMTADQIVTSLMGDPYDLTFKEVTSSLDGLKNKGLVVLNHFRVSGEKELTVDTYLTFAVDWVFKL